MDNLISGTWFWVLLILAIFSLAVLGWMTKSGSDMFFRSPLSDPEPADEETVLPVLPLPSYHAGNVRQGEVYPITIGQAIQQHLCVRKISGGSFWIVVHTAPDDTGPVPSFNGWAVRIPQNRLIRPEDLLPNNPSA
jgi:hypothetical protein